MKIAITGSEGFIGGYLVQELLDAGHEVVGIDNLSKYGEVGRSFSRDVAYRLVRADVKDTAMLKRVFADVDHVIAGAAMIGGISYFHTLAYDLFAENERITASTFDAAIHAFQHGRLKKITVLSSSMVFENAAVFPTPESTARTCPPPQSTYGFQKLAVEYFAQGAWEQYSLPYTIVRPFNCVGIGERRAKVDREVKSGDITLAMSHVVPDFVQKLAKGQDPLRVLGSGSQIRHYTYGGDLARGIRICMEHERAVNEDFNISTPVGHTVLELGAAIWGRLHPGQPFRYEFEPGFKYDVQRRIPDTSKARDLLGISCTTSLDAILDEVVPWVVEQVRRGTI
jgi:nucleoside-diphosphate-sugar epimerase